MNTTDNEVQHSDDPEVQAQIKHRNETGNIPTEDTSPTQEQINESTGTNPILDAPDQRALDMADDDKSRLPVDGNGLREHTDEDVDKTDSEQEHAKAVAEKQRNKLDPKASASKH